MYQNNNTTCQITLPSITPKEGYISVGWNTVSGATTGSPAGNNVTLSNNTTYYANAIDNIAPEVTFNPNTQSTFIAGGKAVTVKISDAASGLKANQQISYAWSTSNTTAPTFSNTVTTSNQAGDKSVEVTIPETSSANLTGSYYLWIKSGISDTLNNVSTNKISEVFKFDNEDPTLTISTTSSSTTIIVVANATAASGISKYEYSKDGGKTWEDGGTNNTYRFTGLTPSTTYNIMARITNGVGKQATAAATQYIDITENPVTSGDGLYEDPTTEDRYIYKGAKPNNYVNFNNELWRIIAQEPDNTLKIIRVTPLSSRAFDNSNNRSSTYCNSSSNGCNAWGNNETTYDKNGSKVTAISDTYSSNTTYALPTKEASLNTYLNGDYYNSLTETARNQIDTHMFNVGNVSASTSNTINTDMLEEEKYKWLGKIGLLNLTDYVKASSNKNCTKVASYSSTAQCSDNSQSHNWITVDIDANHPRFINGNSGTRINVWGINSSSYKIGSAGKANVSYGVKPVLYLKSNVKVISGEGTQTNPYELGEGVSTTDSDKATFTEEGLYPKTVTIHFPDGCGDNLTCSYKQDNGQSINVTTQTVELEYTQNGTIVANVSNGVNTETSSYTVEIKLRAVDLSYDKNKTNLNCAEIQCALEAIDKRR